MHGLTQSRILTRAAQTLSKARAYHKQDPEGKAGLERLETALEAYQAAFKAYTNPFDAKKNFP